MMVAIIQGLNVFSKQPRAFYIIFMLEIWERFGFYTMQSILTLYFIQALELSSSKAYFTFGAFSALVYGLVAIGGYLGDKVLGTKRTIIIGLITLAAGYLALALSAKPYVFFALGLVCVGNGLFKANPSSLLAKSYNAQDVRLDSGFTMYYMAINLGSILALLIGPFLSTHYGYKCAFFASFLGLVTACVNYGVQKKSLSTIKTHADLNPIYWWQWGLVVIGILIMTCVCAYLLAHVLFAESILWIIAIVVLMTYLWLSKNEIRKNRNQMLIALILMVEAIVFFTLYQQMPTSLNLFAISNVVPKLFGITFDPQNIRALNSFWIILLSPVLAKIYDQLDCYGIAFPTPHKFALGMFCCGISFILLFFSRFLANETGMVSAWWLVVSYLFQSTGELLVSALGVSMIAQLVPRHIEGFAMGMWFLSSSVAGVIGAYVASFTILPHKTLVYQDATALASLQLYTHVFAWIGSITLIISAFMWYIARKLNNYRCLYS